MTTYRRDALTWTAFGALFAFGYLNAALGPSMPYIRSVEHISYVVGALHQVALRWAADSPARCPPGMPVASAGDW